jgi:hypothetical protein
MQIDIPSYKHKKHNNIESIIGEATQGQVRASAQASAEMFWYF